MTGTRPGFRSDARAEMTVLQTIGLVLVILVPLVLFAVLLMYLRRAAPGGSVPAPVGTTAPTIESVTRGARKCGRCGVDVQPQRGRGSTICPNCGVMLSA